MHKYAITSKNNNNWEVTNCTSERSAKRKATTEYGAGFNDDVLMVAEASKHGGLYTYKLVATKFNSPGSKWINW